MTTALRSAWFFATILSLPLMAAAQDVQVVASISHNVIGVEETVSYSIEIKGSAVSGVRTPDAPQTEGLALAQRFPSTSRNVTLVNGVVSQSVNFTWIFRPLGEGSASFGPSSVQVGDRTFTTRPIEVEVVAQTQRPQRQAPAVRNPFAPFQSQEAAEPQAPPDAGDLFIRVIPSKQTARRGEQVTIRYDLYFREGIQLRQSRLTDSWDAEGFWREDLDVDARPVPRVVVENGLRYNMITLKRAAVFPTRAGELAVDPLKIESEAVLPVRTRDPFADFFSLRSRFTPVELSSSRFTLQVDPLPSPEPDGFAGAVGQYDMSTSLDRTEVEVGASLQFSVVIRGTGNLATLAPPVFRPPGAFELYEPEVSVSLDRTGSQLRGSKTFRYVMVPRANGSFEMPGLAFHYFDPVAGEYRIRSSNPVTVAVSGSASSLPPPRANAAGLPVDDVAAPIRDSGGWIQTSAAPIHRRPWVLLLLGLPAIALVAVRIIEKRRVADLADPSAVRRRRSGPLARKYLKEADAHLGGTRSAAFFEALERAVLGYIGNRLNVSEFGLTRERLRASLEKAGIQEETCSMVLDFLDACDRGRFAPISPSLEERQDRRDQAADLLVQLEDSFNQAAPDA